MTTRLKILFPAIGFAFGIQVAVWLYPRSTFANVINHIAAYGWCSIICAIVVAIPLAGLLGLFLHVRDFLESKIMWDQTTRLRRPRRTKK